ncbi:MAG: hypothetical protein K0M73_02255, partial [Hydrogenophaga sp.]|nr:hypothetical protein [Hydrogenophaga sp.]
MLDDHTHTSSTPPSASDHPWNTDVCLALIQRLWALRKSMLAAEHRYALAIERAGAHQRDSARNLVHFLAMRATDLRGLQSQLAWLGVSSLGRSESHVLANVDKVLGILHRLTGQAWQELSPEEPAGSVTGPLLLQRHTDMLLGPAVRDRHVRIMVTLPSEPATDPALVRRLVQAGMDVGRQNNPHDAPQRRKNNARVERRAVTPATR